MDKPRKIRVVILEGAEKVGKSYMTRLLNENVPNFLPISILTDDTQIQRHTPAEKREFIGRLEKMNTGFVYVMDRFLLTDLIYNRTLRHDRESIGFRTIMAEFSRKFDVLCVKLTRSHTMKDYKDDKIEMLSSQLNEIISSYHHEDFSGAINWNRRVVNEEGTILSDAAEKLMIDLAFVFEQNGLASGRPLLVQERYAHDFWRFGVACICLNNTTGYRARKVVPELFYHLPNPRALFNKPYDLESLIKPLGMQSIRTKMLLQFTQDVIKSGRFDNYEDEDLPNFHGVGKYFRDSHRLFVRGINDLDQYGKPLDKELEKILASGGVN